MQYCMAGYRLVICQSVEKKRQVAADHGVLHVQQPRHHGPVALTSGKNTSGSRSLELMFGWIEELFGLCSVPWRSSSLQRDRHASG